MATDDWGRLASDSECAPRWMVDVCFRNFLLLMLAGLLACGPSNVLNNKEVELILIGLDGASWNLMKPMMERGALTNLERMVEKGVYGPMRSNLPCLSIVLWTSIATGKRPEVHGITGWEFEDPDTGKKGLMNANQRRVEALWNIVSRRGGSVGFVNWWATWPAEPVSGYMVSEQITRTKLGGYLERGTYPESLSDSLAAMLSDKRWPWLESVLEDGRLKLLSDRIGPSRKGSVTGEATRYQQAFFLYGQDYLAERAAFHLLRTTARPQLFGYLSRKIDIASHYMWEFLSEESLDYEAASHILEPVYRYEDALLGRFLAEVGPDANIIVLSDHGFRWESDGLGHEESAPDGIFLAMGPAFDKGKAVPEIMLYDIAPTVLHVLGLPTARDMAGVPLEQGLVLRRPIRKVDSFEIGGRSRDVLRSPIEEKIFRELKSLGYFH